MANSTVGSLEVFCDGALLANVTDAQWFKSRRSEAGKDCVEVAWLANGHVGVRDSKNPTGPALVFTPGEWDAFIAGAADGEFNRT